MNPRIVRLVMWGSGVLAGIALLFAASMLMFGPTAQDDEPDHSPPGRTMRSNDGR